MFTSHDENFHQVWSWYDHPSSSVLAADRLRDLVTLTLTFNLLTLVSDHTRRVTWQIPPLRLRILPHFYGCSWVMSSHTSALNMTLTTWATGHARSRGAWKQLESDGARALFPAQFFSVCTHWQKCEAHKVLSVILAIVSEERARMWAGAQRDGRPAEYCFEINKYR